MEKPVELLGITQLAELDDGLQRAVAAGTGYAFSPMLALQVVRTAERAILDAGRAFADHVADRDWIVDATFRLRNLRRALKNATKVRVPKRLHREPAVLRLRAIVVRALEWDDDAEAEMVAEWGQGAEREEVVDDLTEDFDATIPEDGQPFEDRWGNRYRVVGYDDSELALEVELVEATQWIPLSDYLDFMRIPEEVREARIVAAQRDQETGA